MEELDDFAFSLGQMFEENNHKFSSDFLLQLSKKIHTAPRTSYLRINTLCIDATQALQILADLTTGWQWNSEPELSETYPLILIRSKGPVAVVPYEKEVIVSRECGQSVLRGADVYVAGVLGIERGSAVGCYVSVWADCENRCTRGFKNKYNADAKIFLGNGVLKMCHEDIFRDHIVSGLAVEMKDLEWQSPSFERLPKSLFYPQNLPSILAVEELGLSPSMVVLDMCASPGGKTSHIAAKLENKGLVLAFDKNKNKVAKLTRTLEQYQVTCARAFVADSTKLCAVDPNNGLNAESYTAGSFLLPNSFDRILLDPPCSGIGQRPSLRPEIMTKPTRASFAVYQRKLLEVAVKLLRPGGRLVYSTCTLNPEENEANVAFAISRGLTLVSPNCTFGSPGLIVCGITMDESFLVKRFWPTGNEDSIAFFFAIFEKPAPTIT